MYIFAPHFTVFLTVLSSWPALEKDPHAKVPLGMQLPWLGFPTAAVPFGCCWLSMGHPWLQSLLPRSVPRHISSAVCPASCGWHRHFEMSFKSAWGFWGSLWALYACFRGTWNQLWPPQQPCYQIPAVDAQYAAVVQIFPTVFSSFNLQDSAQKAWTCSPAFCKGLEEMVNFKEGLFGE